MSQIFGDEGSTRIRSERLPFIYIPENQIKLIRENYRFYPSPVYMRFSVYK
jgi:hypothetical protein